MNADEQDRLKKLLRDALPAAGGEPEPGRGAENGPWRDLWPAVSRRIDAKPATPWYDWALLAGLVGLAGLFPAAIPVLLYYL
jgi:hypothetical protein